MGGTETVIQLLGAINDTSYKDMIAIIKIGYYKSEALSPARGRLCRLCFSLGFDRILAGDMIFCVFGCCCVCCFSLRRFFDGVC